MATTGLRPHDTPPTRPREWLAVYVATTGRPKYRRLTPRGRGALLHLWILAAGQFPEATWSSRSDLDEYMTLDGFETGDVDELERGGWLDTLEDGRVVVHDWDDWQMAASEAIKRAWEADRLRTWRRARREVSPPEPPSLQNSRTPTETATVQGIRTPYDGVRTPNGEPLKGRTNGPSLVQRDPTSCPRCGDLVTPGDANTIVDLVDHVRVWHRACPTLEAPA